MNRSILLFFLVLFSISLVASTTTVTDSLVNTTGNITGNYYCNSTNCYQIDSFLSTTNSTYNTWAYNQTIPANTYTDSTNLTNFNWITSTFVTIANQYIYKWSTGNFVGALYTYGTDPSSDSNAIFQTIGSDGTPRFQVQDGGTNQASFIARSFMVVNQNNTRLNQSQNNLCSEWGFLHIDCNSSTTGADMGVQDDFEAQGILYTDSGIYGDTSKGGVYLALGNLTNFSEGGVNGTFTVSTNVFCDYVANPFSQSQVDAENWILIQEGDYEGAPTKMKAFINSSCVEVGNNPSWTEDLSDQKYFFRNVPVFLVLGGGFSEFYVGDDVQSKMEINIRNGTGNTGFQVKTKSGVDQHCASVFEADVKGYDGTVGIFDKIYSSVASQNIDSKNMFLEFIADNFNDSHHTFLETDIVGTKGSGMTIDLIDISGAFDTYIKSGSTDAISKVYYDNGAGSTTDITSSAISESSDANIFENDNSIIYIGSTTNFTKIGISLNTTASKDLNFEYSYCLSNGTWISVAGVVDTTSGFKSSGLINGENPSDRGSCNQEIDGTAFANVTNYSYIAIKRTLNNVATTPIEGKFSISGSSTNFILAEDYIKLNGASAPPLTCDATVDGAIYYDSDIQFHCSCKAGTGWVQMNDYSTGCS